MAGLDITTLQSAYDAAVTPPQIEIDATPNGLVIEGQVNGTILAVRTSAAVDVLDVVNQGRVDVNGQQIIRDAFLNSNTGRSLIIDDTFPTGGAFVGGAITSLGTVTYDAATFIWALLAENKVYAAAASPGFAAFTLFNALPTIQNSGNFNLTQALVLNVGVVHARVTSGTSTTPATFGVSFSPQTRAAILGATMTKTQGDTAVNCHPTFSTVFGSVVNLGTVRGLRMQNPSVAIFQPSAGVENMTGLVGVEVDAIPFGGNVTKRALRSALTPASNTLMIENTGGAESDFGVGDIHFDDAGGVVFGTGNDVRIAWDNAASAWNWEPAVGEDLGIAFGVATGKPFYLFEAASFGVSEVNYTQIRFGFDRYAFGQAGSIGNQVGLFVAPSRTVDVAGGWSDYLLTQGGNLDITTFAMSDVAAWTINAISLDAATGSIVTLDTLVVGGMTTSNPGITVTERSSLRVRGRKKQEGSVQYPPITPAALGAGDNDDWAGLLTGSPSNNGRYWARVTGNATTSVITGIDATAVQDGDTFELTNVGTETILIENEGTGSVAANRIITGQAGSIAPNFVLSADRSMALRYDATDSRWRVITPPGAVAPLSGHWRFSSTTTMADPGSGTFRNNNATLASVTSIAISDISFRGGDASAIIASLASGDQLYIQNETDAAEYMVFNVTGTTDNTTWWQIDGSVGDSGNAFTNNAEFNIIMIFA